MSFELYDFNYRVPGVDGSPYLGRTNSHQLPRIGEALTWRGQTYRVKDIVHPTEDDSQTGIYRPRVLVYVDDVRWLADNDASRTTNTGS